MKATRAVDMVSKVRRLVNDYTIDTALPGATNETVDGTLWTNQQVLDALNLATKSYAMFTGCTYTMENVRFDSEDGIAKIPMEVMNLRHINVSDYVFPVPENYMAIVGSGLVEPGWNGFSWSYDATLFENAITPMSDGSMLIDGAFGAWVMLANSSDGSVVFNEGRYVGEDYNNPNGTWLTLLAGGAYYEMDDGDVLVIGGENRGGEDWFIKKIDMSTYTMQSLNTIGGNAREYSTGVRGFLYCSNYYTGRARRLGQNKFLMCIRDYSYLYDLPYRTGWQIYDYSNNTTSDMFVSPDGSGNSYSYPSLLYAYQDASDPNIAHVGVGSRYGGDGDNACRRWTLNIDTKVWTINGASTTNKYYFEDENYYFGTSFYGDENCHIDKISKATNEITEFNGMTLSMQPGPERMFVYGGKLYAVSESLYNEDSNRCSVYVFDETGRDFIETGITMIRSTGDFTYDEYPDMDITKSSFDTLGVAATKDGYVFCMSNSARSWGVTTQNKAIFLRSIEPLDWLD